MTIEENPFDHILYEEWLCATCRGVHTRFFAWSAVCDDDLSQVGLLSVFPLQNSSLDNAIV